MFDKVDLIIHHGGNFVSLPETMYVGGEVDCIPIDPDLICYPHLMKALQSGNYGNIKGLFYKKPSDAMDDLLPLFNDASTLQLIHMASTCGQCEIYVEHGLDECELILPLPGPNNEGLIEEVEVQQAGLTPEEELQTNVEQTEVQMHTDKAYELHPEAEDCTSEEERQATMEEIYEDGLSSEEDIEVEERHNDVQAGSHSRDKGIDGDEPEEDEPEIEEAEADNEENEPQIEENRENSQLSPPTLGGKSIESMYNFFGQLGSHISK
ncbi:unnamed protein product [Cuscuta epithymum]|uniref:PB1-like domain-containing protein n=1 Tax=Cuscuta epithymum TaxID=186058 RepID=A0AAV0EFI9_9ASTE|nr:unnamed protein product [Cuscuta epithymum]